MTADKCFVARAELTLARNDLQPLREVPLAPDPLTLFARAFAELRDDLGEQADVAVDLMPLTPAQTRQRRKRALHGGGEPTRGSDVVAQLLVGLGHAPPRRRGSGGGDSGVEGLERRAADRQVLAALGGTDPMFAIQVLIRVTSRVKGRPQAHLHALVGAFDQWAGDNYFRVAGRRILGRHLGADLPWRRRRFDTRLERGVFRPAKHVVVSARQLAGLLKPPTVHCAASNVVRTGGVVPPPPQALPTYRGQPDLLPLGVVSSLDGERRVGVPLADTFFSYVAGRSRYGKTESNLVRFVALAHAGHGGLYLDPHADALQRVKPYLTDLAERVVELSIARGSVGGRQAGWNPFSMEGVGAEGLEDRFGAIVDSIAAATGWSDINARALSITQMAARSLLELAVILPDELAPTIFQVTRLLSDDDWRAEVVPHLSGEVADYWTSRFPRLSDDAITPLTNLIDRMRSSPTIASLLGSSRSTYSLRQAMDAGGIVLVRLRGTSVVDRLIASFVVNDLVQAALGRVNLPPQRRRAFHVFLDEVQSYDSATKGLIASLLEETAKYGIRVHAMNQQPTRLSPTTLNAILTNRSHLSSSAVGYDSARLLAKEWGSDVAPETITKLDKYQFVAQVTLHGQLSTPFRMRGLSLEETWPHHYRPERVEALERAIDANSGRRPVSETLADLNALDERIVDHLEGRRKVRPLKDPNRPRPDPDGGRRGVYRPDRVRTRT